MQPEALRGTSCWSPRSVRKKFGWDICSGEFRGRDICVCHAWGDTELRELVESMAGLVPVEAVDTVVKLSAGSPFMASAVLRGLVESGALVPENMGWRMEPVRLSELSSSRVSASFLARRLELLPPSCLTLLTVAAVLGKDFGIGPVVEMSGQGSADVWGVIDEARHRHILWASETSGHFAFVHDKLRETLLGRLPAEARRELHLRAAQYFLKRNPESVFEIAYHFAAAGDDRSALPYAFAAAEKARAQHSLKSALEQYLIAERGATASDAETLKRIVKGLGEVYLLRGEYDNAEKQFRKQLQVVSDDFDRAEIEGKLGEIAFKRGDIESARHSLEKALCILGRKVPASRLEFLVMAFWEVFIQVLHTIFPWLFVGRRPLKSASPGERLHIRLFGRLAYAYWFGRGKIPCIWAHFKELNFAERYPPTPELGQAYSTHAPVMSMIPYFKRGARYAEKALSIRRALGDLWGEGQSLHFYGALLYTASRYEECMDKCRQAVRILERTGDRWEGNAANWHIGMCLYRLGDLQSAVDIFRRVYQAGIEIKDHQASTICLAGWSRATGGKFPRN